MAIETIKYLSGSTELDGGIPWLNRKTFEERFPGVRGIRVDSFGLYAGVAKNSEELMPVTRIVEYQKNPSLHKCDARCRSAKGHSCECSCGGKNHGINHR
jgi:hypothetical protein